MLFRSALEPDRSAGPNIVSARARHLNPFQGCREDAVLDQCSSEQWARTPGRCEPVVLSVGTEPYSLRRMTAVKTEPLGIPNSRADTNIGRREPRGNIR